jgi:G3E family GTPase
MTTTPLIPVTLLTGFLGAGKTTLLNALLKRRELADTAVLINEFGEIGLDHLLVERVDESTVLLQSGCLCCTVRGDLSRALASVADRADAGQSIRRAVIETTGLADPAPIIATLMADPFIARRYRLDGVVTLVDAATGMATLDHHAEAVKQAAVADRIVLTKADLAPDTAALRTRLAALNPGAPIIEAAHGVIDPAAILECGLYRPDSKAPDVARWLNEEGFSAQGALHPHGHGDHHGHGHHHHHDVNRHDARIRAACFRFEKPLHWEGLATWLQMLVATRGDGLLRIKGILNLAGEDRPVAIHAVQHLFHPPARLSAWPAGDDRASRLVFILRDLDPRLVADGLRAFSDAAEERAAVLAGAAQSPSPCPSP